jgi:hypothetical protein
MPFTLIKGLFHVQNYSPDGDSVRFEPANPDLVRGLAGPPARFNARGHVQLRIEAIDALETHFSPPSGGGILHQPRALADAATNRLVKFTGITDVRWDATHSTVISANDAVPGYVLARTVEKNGRPVAFVFAGDPSDEDGASVRLDGKRLRETYNYAALAEGLVYPTYYRGLFQDLRDELTAAVKSARTKNLSIHAVDVTTKGFDASKLKSIMDQRPILPKLFRRLSEYLVNFGTADGFKEKLEESAEPVLDLKTSNFTHFDTFIEQAHGSDHIRLLREPEELVFDEMVARPSHAFSSLMEEHRRPRAIHVGTAPVKESTIEV